MRYLALLLLLIAVLSFGFDNTVLARDSQRRQCTKDEAIQALTEAAWLNDWDQVYRSYRRFSQCDDGAIAEGYSDSVSKLLANDWSSFGRLLTLTSADRMFRQFVLNHIDPTVPQVVLLNISTNAQSKCPVGGRSLCHLVLRSVEQTTRKQRSPK
jgi:hypothetical protein